MLLGLWETTCDTYVLVETLEVLLAVALVVVLVVVSVLVWHRRTYKCISNI